LGLALTPLNSIAATSTVKSTTIPVLQSTDTISSGVIGKLVWSDEFLGKAGDQPNSITWSSNLGSYKSNSITIQSPELAKLDGSKSGLLNISVKKINDPSLYHGICGGGKLCQFQSGWVSTRNLLTFQYGYIESRVRMPKGEGNWPAMWFLRDGNYDSANPTPGEIDLFEWYGKYPKTTWSALHFSGITDPSSGKLITSKTGAKSLESSLSEGFHVYGMAWLPSSITFYIDGKPFQRFKSDDITSWPFNNPYYLIFSTGVGPQPNTIYGGTWSGWQQSTMSVDWVRVWKIDGYGQVNKRAILPMTPDEMLQLLK
jgi:hypothetical protein